MKRKELRSGMTIETQGGELGLIVKTDLGLMVLFVESTQWESVKDYRKDLTHKMHQDLDVVRVYSPTSGHQIIPFHAKSGSLMFDRVLENSHFEELLENYLQEIDEFVKRCTPE